MHVAGNVVGVDRLGEDQLDDRSQFGLFEARGEIGIARDHDDRSFGRVLVNEFRQLDSVGRRDVQIEQHAAVRCPP